MNGIIRSRAASLLTDHVDTDQIIPARFLKTVDREGLADHLFADWRRAPDFPLRPFPEAEVRILVAGANFGCGSSREHAAWALRGAGFDAVVAGSFADIFKDNAIRNQLVPVAPSGPDYDRLRAQLKRDSDVELEIDIAEQALRFEGVSLPFSLDPFAKDCLLSGISPFSYLLEHGPQIGAYEARNG